MFPYHNSGGAERHRLLQLCGRQHPGGERQLRLPGDQQDQLPLTLALAGAGGPLLTVTMLSPYHPHSPAFKNVMKSYI